MALVMQALLFAIALLTFSTPLQARPATLPGTYYCQPIKVRDGASIVCRVRIWLDDYRYTAVRVRGIDTPEIRRCKVATAPGCAKCQEEHELGLKAKALAERVFGPLIASEATHQVRILNIGRETYGRTLADLQVLIDGAWTDWSGYLIGRGLAERYDGGKKPSWCPR